MRTIALVAVAAAAVGVFALLRSPAPRYPVTIVLDSANGLVAGADVRAGGVKVGVVKRIDLGDDDRPRVKLAVDDDYRLREGATADLRLASQAGQLNRYIELTRGTGAKLRPGVTLGRASTDQPVELDDALSTLTPQTRADVRTLLGAVDDSTRGRGADIDLALRRSDALLNNTADLLGDVTADGTALKQLIRDGRTVTAALASDPAGLQATAGDLATTLDTVARRRGDVADSLRQLNPALHSTRTSLASFNASIPELQRLVSAAAPVASLARPAAGELRGAMATARPTLLGARRLLSVAPARLTTLEALLGRTKPVIHNLGPALDEFNPVLDHLRARAPDIFGWLPLLGDALSDYDANGHAANLLLDLQPPPTNLIGPSDNVSGALRRPFDRTPGSLEDEPWTDYTGSFIGGGEDPTKIKVPQP